MSSVDVSAGFGLSDYALKPQIDTAVREKGTQAEIDADLEREIETWRLSMTRAATDGDIETAREYEAVMRRCIGNRSPQQIERMEAKLPKKWGSL